MKNKLNLKYSLLQALVYTFIATSGFGQMPHGPNDTIQHRMVSMVLPDSSIIRYEIGQIREISNGNYHYLSFIDSSGSPNSNYLVTHNFTIATSHDSLKLSRFAMFDDQNLKIGSSYSSSAQVDSAADSTISYYLNKEFQPSVSYFTSSSSVSWIIEVVQSSNDSVLQYLDTVRCYLNSDGHLRYTASGSSSNWLKRPILTDSGNNVYLKVALVTNLPLGTTAQYFGRSAPVQAEQNTSRGFAPIYEDRPGYGAKIATGKPVNPRQLDPSLTKFYPNPNTGLLHLGIQTDASGMVNIQIIRTNGQVVYSGDIQLQNGYTPVTLDIHNIPSGSYILNISDVNENISHNLVIQK